MFPDETTWSVRVLSEHASKLKWDEWSGQPWNNRMIPISPDMQATLANHIAESIKERQNKTNVPAKHTWVL
jgi:hypothetical protein